MARTKDTALAERNRRICLLRRNGFTYGEIATMEQISRVRVSQIVAAHMEELGEDEGRAELAGILEFVERKAVGLVNDPGPLMGPNGRPAEDQDGQPVPNNGIAVEGLKILTLVVEKKSRLFAWDKQPKKDPRQHFEESHAAMLAALAAERDRMESRRLAERDRAELESYRARFGTVIPGQVLAELPAAGGEDRQRGGERDA